MVALLMALRLRATVC